MRQTRPTALHQDRSVVDLARRRAQQQPDRKAFIFLRDGEVAAESLTFAELDAWARATAATLASQFRPGDRILLTYPQGLEFVVAFFGCLYAGMLAVPAYPATGTSDIARLERIAQDCAAAGVCIARDALQRTRAALADSVTLRRLRCTTLPAPCAPGDAQAQAWRAPLLDSAALAFLQYTSGSTGAPKGVMVSHGNLLHNQGLIKRGFGNSADTRILSWLPLFHDMGLIGHVMQPLHLGTTSILMSPAAFIAKPVRWLQAITDHRITCSGGPNFAYDLCVRRVTEEQMAGLDLGHWALAYSGAETIRNDTLTRFADKFAACGFRREAFFGCYGMAEATLFVTGGQRGQFPRVLSVDSTALQRHEVRPVAGDSEGRALDVVSCGSAVEQDVAIVDPQTCRRCPPGQIGEIWVRGDSVAQGYWNRAEETAATFSARVADEEAGPYLRTGDLGFLDRGELFVTGRVKDLIIIRGRNFYPHDIESVVRASHPALHAGIGAAFSIDVEGEERLIVLHEVHRHELRRLPHEEVLGAARMALMSELGLPLQDLVLLTHGSLPKTSSGKIRRRASREAYLDQALPGAMAACAGLAS